MRSNIPLSKALQGRIDSGPKKYKKVKISKERRRTENAEVSSRIDRKGDYSQGSDN